jgi:hypothetical protein
MPHLIELPESLVRDLAAKHLSQTKQMINERLEFYFLLYMYGDVKMGIKPQLSDYALAKHFSTPDTAAATRLRLHRARAKARAIMEPVLAEARQNAVDAYATTYEANDDPAPTFTIPNHKTFNDFSVDTTQKNALLKRGVLKRNQSDYTPKG